MKTGVLGFTGLGVSVFALISVIISVSLDYWAYLSNGDSEYHSGLWKQCGSGTCRSFKVVPTELNAVRAMLILALLLDVGAIVCGALKLFMMKENKLLGYVAAGLLLVAGLFLMVGFGVYKSEVYSAFYDNKQYEDNKPKLHAGFAFCIISWLASWAAAALFGVATMQENK